MRLNHHSPLPLYRQLAAHIRQGLEAGDYPVGERIPSENTLSADFGIGRPTVRQATDLLIREGRLERRRGSGTFVRPPPKSIDLFSLAGTSTALKASDLDTRLELVTSPRLVTDEQAKTAMTAPGADGIDTSSASFVLVERRALVEDVPVLFETFLFDSAVFPGLENRSLENVSLSKLIRDEYFLEPVSAHQTFHAKRASPADCDKLAVSRGSPILQVSRSLMFADIGRALTVDILCRTDQFDFTQVLFPAETSAVID